MKNITLLIFMIFYVFRGVTALNYDPNFHGTTPNITDLLIGRCLSYQILSDQNRNPALSIEVDCNQVTNLFINSFSYKDSCKNEVNETSYSELFKIITKNIPLTDQALFWSGTREIAHDYSHINEDVYTLEDTFPGYLANFLTWCGCKYPDPRTKCIKGINYDKCNKNCTAVMNSYWSLASRTFAEKAKGTAYVMVNGTSADNNTAYFRGSFFGKIELPTLGKQKKVVHLIVLVIFNLDAKRKEKCGTGSLVDLVSDAKKFGIRNVECKDEPRDTLFLLCAKYPHARECNALSNADRPITTDRSRQEVTVWIGHASHLKNQWKSVLIGLSVILSAAVFV